MEMMIYWEIDGETESIFYLPRHTQLRGWDTLKKIHSGAAYDTCGSDPGGGWASAFTQVVGGVASREVGVSGAGVSTAGRKGRSSCNIAVDSCCCACFIRAVARKTVGVVSQKTRILPGSLQHVFFIIFGGSRR